MPAGGSPNGQGTTTHGALAKACRLGGAGFFRYESGGSGGMTTDAEVTYETKTVR